MIRSKADPNQFTISPQMRSFILNGPKDKVDAAVRVWLKVLESHVNYTGNSAEVEFPNEDFTLVIEPRAS